MDSCPRGRSTACYLSVGRTASPIDYLHVTIEGTEPRVFAAGGDWRSRVRSLRVELHPYFGYGAAECIAQLEALGYRAWLAPAPAPAGKWVFAVKD